MFHKLKIAGKQIFFAGIIIICMVASVSFTNIQFISLKEQLDKVSRIWLPRAVSISNIDYNIAILRLNQLQYVISEDPKIKQDQAAILISLIDRINKNLDVYENLKTDSKGNKLYSTEENELFKQFDQNWEEYQDLSLSFFRLARLPQSADEAMDLLNGKMLTVFNALNTDLEKLVSVNQENALLAAQSSDVTLYKTKKISFNIFIITIIISICMVIILVRMIVVPIYQLKKAAGVISQGDLTVRLPVKGDDEFASLSRSFNNMTKSLQESRTKTEEQAEKLKQQNLTLQNTFVELEKKNQELEKAMLQLQETQEQLIMKEKMASLGNLVAGIAHEINNPIGAVHSASDTMKRAILKIKSYMEQAKDINDLHQDKRLLKTFHLLEENSQVSIIASERITKIVKSLKMFARLDEADFQSANIHEGIDSTLTLVHHEIKNRITVEKQYGAIPEVQCFPNELNQVFMNLFVNAAHAIKDTGKIFIKTSTDGTTVTISIADSGEGISKENLSKIFDPGFTTKGVGVGTGLGLSISYNIIKKHQGEIKVNSSEKGTEFLITIPIKQNR